MYCAIIAMKWSKRFVGLTWFSKN